MLTPPHFLGDIKQKVCICTDIIWCLLCSWTWYKGHCRFHIKYIPNTFQMCCVVIMPTHSVKVYVLSCSPTTNYKIKDFLMPSYTNMDTAFRNHSLELKTWWSWRYELQSHLGPRARGDLNVWNRNQINMITISNSLFHLLALDLFSTI